MNRKVVFRGKRKQNGDWIEGSLLSYPNGNTSICKEIVDSEVLVECEVEPKSIGQFTGLFSVDGQRIFEGDILCVNGEYFGVVRFGEYESKQIGEYKSKHIGFWVKWVNSKDENYCIAVWRKDLLFWAKCEECNVCGNVYDNPDLVKEA